MNYKFFTNKQCEYYPCHSNTDELNCLFCYCTAYNDVSCPGISIGSGVYIKNKIGKSIKDCSNCTLCHDINNFTIFSEYNSGV